MLIQPVIVERPPGDRQGPDISSPLITSEPVAVARGLAEIDYNYSNRRMMSVTAHLVPWIAPGEIVHVTDHEEGVYRAMVDRVAMTITRGEDGAMTAQSHLVLERRA